MREISRNLGRNVSSISRELKRNSISKLYVPKTAEEQYHKRRVTAYAKPRKMTDDLKEIICTKLKLLWSP